VYHVDKIYYNGYIFKGIFVSFPEHSLSQLILCQ